MSSSAGKLVCVTGASGYIASWIVKFLLQRDDHKKLEHLLKLEGAKERLQLFKVDVLAENSFDSVVEGCDGVFHTASPFYHNVKDPQMWYMLSKTLAEDAAWKFAKENNLDLVSVNPAMVVGPLLQAELNTSAAAILNLINGNFGLTVTLCCNEILLSALSVSGLYYMLSSKPNPTQLLFLSQVKLKRENMKIEILLC
ncbi:Tetraketide alpha-pyrone reductase 1 [Spatholobus suberectus]|nr:Tetraketide alpha-pyrone reductase 1 [Spatholobus suberectus]